MQELTKSQIIKFTCKKEDHKKLLVDLLAEKSSLSKSLIKKLMSNGAVFQIKKNKKIRFRKAKKYIVEGDKIECYYDQNVDLNQEIEIFEKLHETKYYGIFHKPLGVPTEGGDYGDRTSLVRYIEKRKGFAAPMSRLDKETEGLVVVAYDSMTQCLFQEMWRKDVTKKYQAIIKGKLEGMGAFTTPFNNKFTETKYYCVKIENDKTFVDITATTERKNQIRIHFAEAGHPIVGDSKFGKYSKEDQTLQLISYFLKFKDPLTQHTVKVSLSENLLLF